MPSHAISILGLLTTVVAFSAATPPTRPPATLPQTPATQPQPGQKVVKPFKGVTVILDATDPEQSRVEVDALTCLDSGWLEQVACAPATREHESLVVVNAKPSQIHAALLMAGFEAGAPGRWIYENDKFDVIKPTGEKLDILVRYVDRAGKQVEHDVGKWIREAPAKRDAEPKPFPREPFIFGGSHFEKDPVPPPPPGGARKDAPPATRSATAPAVTQPGGKEQYVADLSGSIIGLVTFGDEMIGFSVVRSDQEAVQEPTWEANPESLPEISTQVTLIIRKWKD